MNFLSLLIVGLFYFAKRNIWNFLVIFVLVAVTGLALYQSQLDIEQVDGVWWSGMWQNFATEMIGAILTFALFEMLINANNRQESLIRQMASRDNATASNATDELRALGYLFDGTLQGKSLVNANLANTNLENAILDQVNFTDANLENARLVNADLSAAWLLGANLLGTDVSSTLFDEKTILPDGTHWTAQADISRFTNPPKQEAQATLISPEDIILPDAPIVEKISLPKRPQSHHYRQMRSKRRAYHLK